MFAALLDDMASLSATKRPRHGGHNSVLSLDRDGLLHLIAKKNKHINTAKKQVERLEKSLEEARKMIVELNGEEESDDDATVGPKRKMKQDGQAPSTLRAYKAALAAAYAAMNFGTRGILTANVAYWSAFEQRSDFFELVRRIDEKLGESGYSHGIRTEVLEKINQLWPIEVVHAAKTLGGMSMRGWDRFRLVLFQARNAEDNGWEPKVLVFADGTEMALASPYCGKTLSRFVNTEFEKLSVSESSDRLSVSYCVEKALLRGIFNILEAAGVADKDAYWSDENDCVVFHFSGDAAKIMRGFDGTNLIARILFMKGISTSQDVLKTQAPERVIPLGFFIGKDSYHNFLKYCSETLKECLRVKREGLKWVRQDGSFFIIRVVWMGGGDWLFIRTMNGLWGKPYSSHPCGVCEITLSMLGTWGSGAAERNFERMAQLAHAVLPGTEFKPFKCPGKVVDDKGKTTWTCKFEAKTIDDITAEAKRAEAASKELVRAHPPRHFGQRWCCPPQWGAMLGMMQVVIACLLHLLLNGTEAMFEFSIRVQVCNNEELCNEINAQLYADKCTMSKVKYVAKKDRVEAAKKPHVSSGVTGCDCYKLIENGIDCKRRFITYLQIAYKQRPTDFVFSFGKDGATTRTPRGGHTAETRRSADLYQKWIAAWEAFDGLWDSLCMRTDETQADKDSVSDIVETRAKLWFDTYSKATSKEHIRLYFHKSEHLAKWVRLYGNLHVFSGQALEHLNAVNHQLARKLSNHKITPVLKKDGTLGHTMVWTVAAGVNGKFLAEHLARQPPRADLLKYRQRVYQLRERLKQEALTPLHTIDE